MKSTVILIQIFLCIIITARFFYLVKNIGYTKEKAITILLEDISKLYSIAKRQYSIYQERAVKYMPYQDIKPFEEKIGTLNVSKYFKFSYLSETNRDILELHFHMLGISSEYRDNAVGLAVLLEKLLQDFYIERLGTIQYPLVHTTHVQEGEAVLWVAKNLYGNRLIQERAYADERKNIPNMEILEDD